MINIKDFVKDLQTKLLAWETERIDIALSASADALQAVTDRVINEGEKSNGGVFGVYAESTQRIKKKKGQTQSPFPAINFSDTNTMWRTTVPVVESTTPNSVTVRIKPTREDREDIMGIHEERFGKIVALNEQEETELIEDYTDQLNQFWQ